MNNKIINIDISETNNKTYPIIIGENLLENAGDYIKKNSNPKKSLIVTNETIFELYKSRLNIENSEFVILKDGEEYKTLETYSKIIDKAMEMHLERKDAIIAFGGGVVGDMAGFAAATCLRGIKFIQIPTTLLAQVDSSIGGKVAVNHSAGKNLVGAFYQPDLVLADITTLKTLPTRQLKTGLGEVLKYAFIEKSCGANSSGLFEYLKENKNKIFNLDEEILADLIEKCCKLKVKVVEQDEKESGLRAILNFGHTFAHSLEKITDFKYFTHGEAVAIGMKMAFDTAILKGLCNIEYAQTAKNLIDFYELSKEIPQKYSKKDIIDGLYSDKKIINNKLRFVLPTNNYEVEIFSNIELNLIENMLENYVKA